MCLPGDHLNYIIFFLFLYSRFNNRQGVIIWKKKSFVCQFIEDRSCVYNFLSKYLLCSSSLDTLDTQFKNLCFDTGRNNIILQFLKLTAKEINDIKDLHCILIWDEMSSQPGIQYDPRADKIIGFEDWGLRRTRKFADHAILFYIRCMISGKHMPIGYGFCNSATNMVQLMRCIKEWLQMIIKTGFKPIATVCDQSSPNVAAINMLVKESNHMRCLQHKQTNK